MQSTLETRKVMVYTSEVCPRIDTESEELSKVIAWADEHPVAYDVVNSTKSKAFGLGSCVYLGWAQRGDGNDVVLERLRVFREHVEGLRRRPSDSKFRTGEESRPILQELSACFTLIHFDDKGFTSGFFRQHAVWAENGETYPRDCLQLDYTPDTLEGILDLFQRWMDPFYGRTTHITVDGVTKRIFPELKKRNTKKKLVKKLKKLKRARV